MVQIQNKLHPITILQKLRRNNENIRHQYNVDLLNYYFPIKTILVKATHNG